MVLELPRIDPSRVQREEFFPHPKRTLEQGREESLTVQGLELAGKERRHRGRAVPLDPEAHRHAVASGRRTHPTTGQRDRGQPFDGGALTARRTRDRRRGGNGATRSRLTTDQKEWEGE